MQVLVLKFLSPSYLREVYAEGKILLSMQKTAYSEAGFGSLLRQQKSELYLYEEIINQKQRFEYKYKQIESMVFPNGAKEKNRKNDLEILVYAAITQIPLITNDGASKSQPGGMLGNKVALKKLGIRVFSPSEALAEIASVGRKSVIYSARVGQISLRNPPHKNDAKP